MAVVAFLANKIKIGHSICKNIGVLHMVRMAQWSKAAFYICRRGFESRI